MGPMSTALNFLLGLAIHVVSTVAFVFSVFYRAVVHLILTGFYPNEYRLVQAGLPTFFCEETKAPFTVVYVLECEGVPDRSKLISKFDQIVKFRTQIRPKCDPSPGFYSPYENLGFIILEKFWVFCWKINHRFRAEDHVFVDDYEGRDDPKVTLEDLIQRKCEELLDTRLDGNKPQWEVHVVVKKEENMTKQKDGQGQVKPLYGLVWGMNHAYGDATSVMQLLRYGLADRPFPVKMEPLEWNRKTGAQSYLGRVWSKVKPFLLTTLGAPLAGNYYAQSLGQKRVPQVDTSEKRGRNHCRVMTLDLTKLKAIQRKYSQDSPVRLVSFLFACVSGALEGALTEANTPMSSVLASTSEASYPYSSLKLTIEVLTLWLDLPLTIRDPVERLRTIDKTVRGATTDLNKDLVALGTRMAGTFIAPLFRLLEESDALVNFTYISNVVGPSEEITVFGGDPVTSMYIYSPISLEEFTAFLALSYGDKMTLALVAPDRVVGKDPRVLDLLVEGVRKELGNYERLCKL